MSQNSMETAKATLAEMPRVGRKPGKTTGGIDRVGEVVELLTDQILAGAFDPDGQLPAESELQIRFDFSRTVVREAMRILRSKGLVEMSQGKPAKVRPPDTQTVVEYLKLLHRRNQVTLPQLAEARLPIESEIAAIAAERADAVHLSRLQEALDGMAQMRGVEEFAKFDFGFHQRLAEATGNVLLVLLIETFGKLIHDMVPRRLKLAGHDVVLGEHRKIFAAVRARDPEAARKAMQDHLNISGAIPG